MSQLPTPALVRTLLRQRRSVFPATYTDEPIDRKVIEEMLENANWAPNHKRTEPWRFKVIRGSARQQLADQLTHIYRSTTNEEKFSEKKFKKLSTNPLKADTIIAICMKRDPTASLPEWEELAAMAIAVQNMWLTATAYGLGSYWSSPGLVSHLNDFLKLSEGERCYGLFYVANHCCPETKRERGDIADKVVWME